MGAASEYAVSLFEAGAVRFGTFTLKSGRISPVYLDLRVLVSFPQLLRQSGEILCERMKGLRFDRISGIPYAGLPIGVAASITGNYPLCYAREQAKQYGTGRRIEGAYNAGERVLLIDDVISDGGAKIEAAAPFRDAGLIVEDVLVLVDREQGGAARLAEAGLRLHACFTLSDILDALSADGRVDAATVRQVREYQEKERSSAGVEGAG